jgi:hypothetical protein
MTMKAANQNTLASSFVVLVILFTGMVMAARGPRSFTTPEDGAQAFVAALRDDDRSALSNILGPGGEDIINSGDERQYRKAVKAFLTAYDSHSDIVHKGPAVAVLNVGNDDGPPPVRLVKDVAGWHFDATAARRAILAPQIGSNQTAAIPSPKTTWGPTRPTSPAK